MTVLEWLFSLFLLIILLELTVFNHLIYFISYKNQKNMQETSSFLQVQFDNIYLHAKPNRAVRNFDSSSQRKKRRKTLQYAKYVSSMSLSFKNNHIFITYVSEYFFLYLTYNMPVLHSYKTSQLICSANQLIGFLWGQHWHSMG